MDTQSKNLAEYEDADDIIDRLKYTDDERAERLLRETVREMIDADIIMSITNQFDATTRIKLYKKVILMAKVIPEHVDILGQPLEEGSFVVASRRGSYSSTMLICKITKVHPKTVTIKEARLGAPDREWSVKPAETVKLSGEDAIAYILKYV